MDMEAWKNSKALKETESVFEKDHIHQMFHEDEETNWSRLDEFIYGCTAVIKSNVTSAHGKANTKGDTRFDRDCHPSVSRNM